MEFTRVHLFSSNYSLTQLYPQIIEGNSFYSFQMNSAGIMMVSTLLVATVSVEIVGTICCLLALPMLVCKIWWVNCDKQHWEDEETGQKPKKQRWVEVSQLFLSETVGLVHFSLYSSMQYYYLHVKTTHCLYPLLRALDCASEKHI